MTDAEKVDARGLSCPQPAFMTRRALEAAGGGVVHVLVDTRTQVQNCARAGEQLGWSVSFDEADGTFELAFRK
ncbi:MAG: sulfurtransferase TusA family protein [Planctomycetota bacterium]|nr:sulfurtransferase TusA family protein [Planctomycetota bacterium]